MVTKSLKPVTKSSRGTVLIDKSDLWDGSPYKPLVRKIASSGGRNSRGVITVRHRGGGCKKSYRIVDFKRCDLDVEGVVERLEYDPNRTSFLALIAYVNGKKSYIIAPHGIKIGDSVVSTNSVDVSLGNCLLLKNIPVGSFVHNIELRPGEGGILARAAGGYAQLMGKDDGYVLLRLTSGQIRKVLSTCRATIGVVSNIDNQNIKLGKAGRNRWLGVRPTVRGVAMNPVDHPHGGGEGKTSGGRHPVTPWGVSTKGKKTRKKGKSSDKYINKRSSGKR